MLYYHSEASMIIDNDTQEIIDDEKKNKLDSAVRALPTRAQRIAKYNAAMDKICDPNNAPWPSDGQPGDMGDRVRKVMKMTVKQRIEAMTASKTGGAYADALEMQERGFAIGHFPG